MSCCGGKRQGFRVPDNGSSDSRASAIAPVLMQYAGNSTLRVLGPVTGMLYEFGARGAKVLVDGRDAVHMRQVPNLRATA